MLNGIDPVIIFQFSALSSIDTDILFGSIPVVSQIPTVIEQPPIPIYLSESLTGLFIDTEDKSVDIETDVETKSSGAEPTVNQKGISSVISVSLKANKNSIGLSLLSALIDKIFEKVTSKEYAITYMHGPITVFRGLLRSYQVSQSADNDLMDIKIEISKGQKAPTETPAGPTAERLTDAQVLGD